MTATCVNCRQAVFFAAGLWRHSLGSKDVLCWVEPPKATPDPETLTIDEVAAVWPTDPLKSAERELARFYRTLPENPEESVGMTDERYVLMGVVHTCLCAAQRAAMALNPEAKLGEPWFQGVSDGIRLVEMMRNDLSDRPGGLPRPDIIGDGWCYASQIETALAQSWELWERAEWAAGRPRMTEQEAAADIAERIRW